MTSSLLSVHIGNGSRAHVRRRTRPGESSGQRQRSMSPAFSSPCERLKEESSVEIQLMYIIYIIAFISYIIYI